MKCNVRFFLKNTFFVAQILLYEEQPKRLVLIPQATSIILVMDSPIDISHPQLKAKRIYSRLQSAEILPYQSIVRMAMSMNGAAIHRNTYHFYMYVLPKLKHKNTNKKRWMRFFTKLFHFSQNTQQKKQLTSRGSNFLPCLVHRSYFFVPKMRKCPTQQYTGK